MKPNRVAPTLGKILALTLPAAACGGAIDTDGFERAACGDAGGLAHLADLRLAQPADALVLRRRDMGGGTHSDAETFGAPCEAAPDRPACQAAVEAATSEAGFRLGQCVQLCDEGFLIVNRGQEVTVVDTTEGVLELLGEIDTRGEALLVATLGGYTVRCADERGGTKIVGDGHEVLATRITRDCDPVETTLYRLHVSKDGQIRELETEVLDSQSGVCIGRRPEGLRDARLAAGADPIGRYWARVAHLEAASVHAFAALRRELAHHGAPASMLRRAERAMRDEVRHASITRRLASRHGVVAPRPRVERRPVRELEAIAIENAAEGCVRETFGALVGLWQARTARDPEVRRAMGRIARDEIRHASLAWAVDEWARARLSAEARSRVESARREALEGLGRSGNGGPAPALVASAGLPDARSERALARRFRDAVEVRESAG
jgi:hypothetical protein